jgi:hypothetical protein
VTLPPLSDQEAADFVLSMTPTERAIMRHFVEKRGRRYQTIADKVGVGYSEVQALGHKLQGARLAHISVIPFNGCRLFLNHRGERVKRAAEILDALENNRAQARGL